MDQLSKIKQVPLKHFLAAGDEPQVEHRGRLIEHQR